ncbi:potassium/sodium hyperpolarization-activated cyclic nucleotide-gated channel 1-like [Hydractinia symbiolongicarpus]|uniref:potassium/sodium hyperpolarization-activated cyclic nucleotide-gated channel 1-like n=1 Tax=Hydractinia symbiolongicarpus TaxID=13093 RepID=UPI00254C93CE|nr:potassium/sodium hyperpolarization-activated cyclic nucleotide-gated channel 1-like [Hydractinia symbiolongicarpus]
MHHKVRSWLIPSETPANVKIFGGRRAVQEEQIRSRNAGWIIHPYSNMRYYWDLVIMLFLLTNLVVLPLNIAFFTTENLSSWVAFHCCADALFVLDIIFNFRTGYREEDGFRMIIVLDPKLVAVRYAKSWLALDVISSFPVDNILLLISGSSSDFSLGVKSASRAFKFLRLAKFLSLLKLLRLSRVLRYVSKYEEFYHVTTSVFRYIKLVLMMLLVAHWNGCLGFLVPLMQEFPKNSWVALNGLENAHWSEQYGWALFKSLSHMLCIGYGRFIPQLLSEACITIFSMITGATFYALFIAHSMAYIQQSDSARRQYQEKFKQIEEYMTYRNLPLSTRERITDYYEHKYTQKRLFNETEILAEVSLPIRNDIVNHNCRDLIESVPFLKEGGNDFVMLVIKKLSFDVYLPGDFIIKEGTVGDEMYFIRNGVVDILVGDVHVATLQEGDYFGEITMLTDARRVASVKAATVCDLFILSKDSLYIALEEFPEMRVIMEHVALDRLMKLKQRFLTSNNTADATYDLENRRKSSTTSLPQGSGVGQHSTTVKVSNAAIDNEFTSTGTLHRKFKDSLCDARHLTKEDLRQYTHNEHRSLINMESQSFQERTDCLTGRIRSCYCDICNVDHVVV